MRKEIILPGIAVIGGILGSIVRRWDLATAFEPDTGLVIPHMPSTYVLLILSAAVVLVLALLCRGRHRSFPKGYDQAFCAKGNTVYITATILSAFLLLGAGVLFIWMFFTGENTMITRLLLAILCVVSFGCAIFTGKNNYNGEGKGKYSFTLLMPAYTFCMWLIAAYQARAADPVILDYLYELFAIIGALLGLYFTAGFSFERAKVFRASYFSLLGIYFSLVTLADHHDMPTILLYGFAILYLLASVMVLLSNAGRPEGPRTLDTGRGLEIEEFETETEEQVDEP